MNRQSSYSALASILLGVLIGALLPLTSVAQNASPGKAASATETDSEQKERIAAERFLELLKKKPRTGTAFDKVYGYHVNRGTLDQFTDALRKEVDEKNSGEAALLLGIVQSQRGLDAEARKAYEKAEERLPKEPLASYYLGKTLVMLGEVDAAIAAFERAIERKPAKVDLLLVFQDLGRIYQRTRRGDDAVAVWKRMETLFPGDTQVQEQIANILEEEGAHADALERYQSLAKTTTDRFRKIEMSVRAAQIKTLLGKSSEAISDFEQLLTQVNPSSWLYQDIRRRIDNSFLDRNDNTGLTEYYTQWCNKHPDDIDAMMRIGRLLSIARRTPEARQWFAKAIERAPSQPEPRQALVEALERDGDMPAAIEAMQGLVALQPDNADYLVRLGELQFNNRKLADKERAENAAKTWRKLLDKGGNDPVKVARVADLLRGIEFNDEAIGLYRKAISLAENEPQYREYLGEYLFKLNRPDEALAAWRELASGPRENRDNLVRLSEVLSTFKFTDEALSTLAKACTMKPTFGHRLRYVERLREASQHDNALEQLKLAQSMAETDDEKSLVLEQEIKCYLANGQLATRIAQLETELNGESAKSAENWIRLSLYQEADGKYGQSTLAIAKAIEIAPQSIPALTIAARVNERAGQLAGSIDALRKLVAIDRRFTTNYLMQIATIQMRLGQSKEALATAQDLIASNSANSEHFRFYSDLCFQSGQVDQGLDALRRNVRSNPNDREAIGLLARALATQFKTEEATELYWRSFDVARSMEDKKVDVQALAELYLRTNRFEQLITRLNNIGREENKMREATLLCAVAHQFAGDFGAARELLEPLLRENSRDPDLLRTMIMLAQGESDWEAAVNYQRQLNEVTPSLEGTLQLARFMLDKGDVSEAEAIWLKLSQGRPSNESVTQTLSTLVERGETEKAVAVIDRILPTMGDNWEGLMTCAYMLYRCGQMDRGNQVADQVLKFNLPLDTLSEYGKRIKAQAANPQSTASSSSASSSSASSRSTSNTAMSATMFASMLTRGSSASRATQALAPLIAMDSNPFASSVRSSANSLRWFSYSDAKITAAALKLAASVKFALSNETVAELSKSAIAKNDADAMWAAYAISETVRMYARVSFSPPSSLDEYQPSYNLLEKLAKAGDADAAASLLSNVQTQITTRWQRSRSENSRPAPLDRAKLDRYAQTLNEHKGSMVDSRRMTVIQLQLAIAKEYKLLGDLDTAQRFADEVRKESGDIKSIAIATELIEWDLPAATTIFTKVLDERYDKRAAQPMLTSNVSYYDVGGFVGTLVASKTDAQPVVDLFTSMRKAQAAYANKLRPSQLATYNPKSQNSGRVSFASGGRIFTMQLSFPAPSALQSAELLVGLRMAFDSQNQELKQAVESSLQRAAEETDEDVMLSAIDRLCYASWLWWAQAKEEALAQMNQLRGLNVASDVTAMIESRMLYEANQIDLALEVLESVKPINQQLMQDRELALLQLILQKGDIERAKRSAEKLFALRLPSDTQLQVANLMYQLNMRELGDAMFQRLRQRSGSEPSMQIQLMNQMQANGNTAGAMEIARQLLRRTRPSLAGVNATAIRTSEDSYRSQALRLLASSNEIKTMISDLEARLAKSPDSNQLIMQLIELYGTTGQREKAAQMMQKIAKTNTNARPQTVIAEARMLQQSNKHKDAVDKYLVAFEKQPDLMNSEYYNFRNAVQQSGRWNEVTRKMSEWDVRRIMMGPGMNLLGDVMREASAADSKLLLIKILNAGGVADIVRVGSYMDASKSLDPEVRKLFLEKLIQSIDKLPIEQCFASISYSSRGQVQGFLDTITKMTGNSTESIEELLVKVRAKSKDHPDFKLLEAYCLGRLEKFDEAADVARSLMQKKEKGPELIDGVTHTGYWELCGQFANTFKKRRIAIELLQPILKDPSAVMGGNPLDYCPRGLLFECLTELNEKVQAKAVLDQAYSELTLKEEAGYPPGYMEYQYMTSVLQFSRQYTSTGYPLEAMMIAQEFLAQPKLIESATTYNGGFNPKSQFDQIIESNKALVKDADVASLIVSIISESAANANEPADKASNADASTTNRATYNATVIEQLFQVRRSYDKQKGTRWQSIIDEFLVRVSKKPEERENVLKALRESQDKLTERTDSAVLAFVLAASAVDETELIVKGGEELAKRISQDQPDAQDAPKDASPSTTQPASDANKSKRANLDTWSAVDPLVKSNQPELALKIAELNVQRSGQHAWDSAEKRMKLAGLLRDMKQIDKAKSELRTSLDLLLPKPNNPTAKPANAK